MIVQNLEGARRGRTIGDMCAYISHCWNQGGLEATPEDIFGYSSSGELSKISDWYWQCRYAEARVNGGEMLEQFEADFATMEASTP